MSTKAKRHTHKYQKVEISGTKVWACGLPDCPHYMPKHMENMVVGKNTICWKCEKVMALDVQNMHMDRPQCYECQMGVEDILEDISKRIVVPRGFDVDEYVKDLVPVEQKTKSKSVEPNDKVKKYLEEYNLSKSESTK